MIIYYSTSITSLFYINSVRLKLSPFENTYDHLTKLYTCHYTLLYETFDMKKFHLMVFIISWCSYSSDYSNVCNNLTDDNSDDNHVEETVK